MPIVPVFGGGGGSTPTPPPAVPTWLDVPTQIERMASQNPNLVYTFTLNTPTNGVGPYSYRVVGGNANRTDGSLKITGNQLELVNQTTNVMTKGLPPDNQIFRVLVWDSAGNFGVGILILWNETDPARLIVVQEEKVLDWDEDADGWVFAGPRNVPPGWTVGDTYASLGDCLTYPRPVTSAETLGDIRANCAPGSAAVALYYTDNSPVVPQQLNLLILRRRLDPTKLGWSWSPTSDFLDWDNLSSFTPTVPLGTSSAFATVDETIAATGRSYRLERAAYASTAGVAPTFEVAEVSGGVSVLESQNTVASSRVVNIIVRPAFNNTSQNFRMGATSASLAVLCRMRAKVTLTGTSPAVDIKVGSTLTGAYNGIRIAGNSGIVFGSDPTVRISGLRVGQLAPLGAYRRSVWGEGAEIGIDFLMAGATTWLAAYPWDPTWTDYPEWDDDALTLDVPQVIGPTQLNYNSANPKSSNAPYAFGGPPSIAPNGQGNITNDMGVISSVVLGSFAGNGARVEISDVQYYWKTLNLQGVVR
jgi:hypothetical protein